MTDPDRSSKSVTQLSRAAAIFGVSLFALAITPSAAAYVGPGAGLGMVVAFFAMVLAVLATVVGIVLWPIRYLARRRRAGAGVSRSSGPNRGPDEDG